MREIKFRAWYPALHKMDNDPYADEFICEGTPLNLAVRAFPDGVEIMQFTGLKDKNGVEIFEGDIIQGKGVTVKDFVDVVSYSTTNANFLYAALRGIEVIGNIYEDPALLTAPSPDKESK